ncbi:sensor histidine kinase [Alkaliphilus crotonatoxidans]
MKCLNAKVRRLLLLCLATTFMGQIYVNPFDSDFRFSLSVVAFALFIYWYQELEIVPVSLITGVFLWFFRTLIQFTQPGAGSFLTLMGVHFPVVIYYLVFGMFLRIFNFRYLHQDRRSFILLLIAADTLANLTEIIIRQEATISQTIFALLLAGLIRGLVTLLVIEALKYYKMLLVKEQHEARYKQLILLTANLKSEIFFLRKSMEDIEEAMAKSYGLYHQLKELQYPDLKDLSFCALSVAKDIHEIKKDYLRVTAGLEKVMPEMKAYGGMYLKDIFNVIEDSFQKTIAKDNKQISLHFKPMGNVFIKRAYELISIINNLITNAIEASPEQGQVRVEAFVKGQHLKIVIRDQGPGIGTDKYDIIFEPGYTTKFDQLTGKMSTGIGLTHVQHLVTVHFNGRIDVFSEIKGGTCFSVELPITNL